MPSRVKDASSRALKRTRHYLHEYPEAGWAFIFGLVAEVVMLSIGRNHPLWQGFFGGVGTSLMAASVFGLLTGMRQEYELQFSSLGIRRIYTHRDTVPDPQWCEWLRGARRQCMLLGVAHSKWARDDAFPEAVRAVVRRREVPIKVFFLDPTGRTAAVRSAEEMREGGRNTVTTIRGAIDRMWRLRQTLDPAEQVFFQLFVYEGTITGTTWIDDFMIVTHYLAGSANVTAPALRIDSTGGDHDLYEVYKGNVLKVEQYCLVAEIQEGNVETYR